MISYAGNLRGRIHALNQYSTPYPVANITVDLYAQSPTGWVFLSRYITEPDGMYYFQNVFPGYYSLQINGRQNYPIMVANQFWQDLPPIFMQY